MKTKKLGTIFPYVTAAIYDNRNRVLASGFDAPNPLARALQRLCGEFGYSPADLRIVRGRYPGWKEVSFQGDSPEGTELIRRPLSPAPDTEECKFGFYV